MIIVTGATGFIGSAMVWQLNQRGENSIITVDTQPPSIRQETLRNRRYERFILKDDLFNFLKVHDQSKKPIRAIIHMGACSSTTELNKTFLYENNFLYTKHLWQWCAQERVPFLYASSAAVYGDGALGFDDREPSKIFHPLNPYGESKAMFDRWVEQNSDGKKPPLWYGLRFFNVFGPNEYLKEDMASVVFKATQQIRQTGKLKLFKSHRPDYKDGEQMRDFVYVKDITRWMLELTTRAISAKYSAPSGIYNMGFGRARTWNDLAAAVFRSLNRPVNIEYIDIPPAMRPRYQYYTQANTSQLLSLQLSTPQWPLENAVSDYLELYLSGGNTQWL